MWPGPPAPLSHNAKIVLVLIGVIILAAFIGWAYIFNLDREEKKQVCQHSGFDDYSFVINHNQVIRGQKYIECYRKEVVNGQLNITTALIPYLQSGGSE